MTPEWMDDAACLGEDPALFLSNGRCADGIAVCRRCPVVDECLTYALTEFDGTSDVAIWGGTTPDERREMRREGRQHLRIVYGGMESDSRGGPHRAP